MDNLEAVGGQSVGSGDAGGRGAAGTHSSSWSRAALQSLRRTQWVRTMRATWAESTRGER